MVQNLSECVSSLIESAIVLINSVCVCILVYDKTNIFLWHQQHYTYSIWKYQLKEFFAFCCCFSSRKITYHTNSRSISTRHYLLFEHIPPPNRIVSIIQLLTQLKEPCLASNIVYFKIILNRLIMLRLVIFIIYYYYYYLALNNQIGSIQFRFKLS